MRTFAVPLNPTAGAWMDAVPAAPEMEERVAMTREEPWTIAQRKR